MMRRRLFTAAIVTVALAGAAAPARADVTLFLGAQTSPENRPTKGFAFGVGLVVLGLEFEYASANDDLSTGAPSLKTGMGNILIQTPVFVFGFQPYFTTGGGMYRERLDNRVDTAFGTNIGGGAK